MTPKTKKGLIVTAIVLMLSGGVFLYIQNKKDPATGLSKDDYIKEIISNEFFGKTSPYAVSYATLSTFGVDFLKAWYDAIKKQLPSFSLGGKVYATLGGKAVA